MSNFFMFHPRTRECLTRVGDGPKSAISYALSSFVGRWQDESYLTHAISGSPYKGIGHWQYSYVAGMEYHYNANTITWG